MSSMSLASATKTTISDDHPRVEALFRERYSAGAAKTDRMFLVLMLIQWVGAIGFAIWLSPYAWAGKTKVLHSHVVAAVVVGGAIVSLPVILAWLRPGQPITRWVASSAQVLISALLIHLTGGRIETHFHIFGSLAFIAFYRDLRLLVPATIIVALDHFVRGAYWPESIYGVANPEWWRFLEHAGWVVFLDIFLILNCVRGYQELRDMCRQQVEVEEARESAVRVERLAAIGGLAASVGHELRNPLAAIRNAHAFIKKKIEKSGGETLPVDATVRSFLDITQRELDAATAIIGNLLDYSRAKDPLPQPTPLLPLITEVLEVVRNERGVKLANEVPNDLPVPDIDRDQFRQVFMNLVQNAIEAMPDADSALVRVSAEGGGATAWRIYVDDNGPGIPPDIIEKIFQPLFSTKAKGTGLGLAVVSGIVERHGGTLAVDSTIGRGTRFIVTLPATPAREQAA